MPGSVTVVGAINLDLVVRAGTLPAPGETVIGGTFERHGGGKGANAAVAAARLGADVRLLAAVGEDDLGQAALLGLSREEVDVSSVATLEGVATGVAVIVVAASGENQIAVASGANLALRGAEVAAAIAAGPRGGVCLLGFEVSEEVVVAAAAAARAAGMQLIVNPAPARALPHELVRLGPILTPNRLELTTIAEADTEAAARELSSRTGAPVVVTLGPEGVLLVDADGAEKIRGHDVAVVDTTGAGDAFSGALAAALAGGATIREAARRANVAAALSVTASGAREGMPDRGTLEAAVQEWVSAGRGV